MQAGAGIGAGYPDDDYLQAGAKVVEKTSDVFGPADLIVKVKEPQTTELPMLRPGQILFTYLHLAASIARAAGETPTHPG